MARLAQTAGLTEIQQEILSTVKTFVDKEIIPHANALEHADEYPQDIVDGMKEMGLFGLTIPEEYGGLGESLLTYALVVEQIARGWMSVSGVINTHFIVAYMLTQHGTAEQKQKYLPRDGRGRGARVVLDVRAGPRLRRRGDQDAGPSRTADGLPDRRREDVADERRHVQPHGGAGARPTRARRSRTRTSPASSWRSPPATARSRPGLLGAREDRQDGLQGRRHHRDGVRRLPDRRRADPRRQARRRVRPDDGRRRGRPGQRRGAGVRDLDPGVRAGRGVRPAAQDVRQADRRAPGRRVQAGRDGHQGRGRAPDDGQRGAAEGRAARATTSRPAWRS